nr:MAG TPA: hypothetical protein [Caudoviricetes sp.]
MKNVLLVLRGYECAERHGVGLLDVVVLVRLVRLFSRLLNLEEGPAVLVKDREIGDALNMVWVVLENQASRKALFDFSDQTFLEYTLASHSFCPFDKSSREETEDHKTWIIPTITPHLSHGQKGHKNPYVKFI